MDLSRIPLAIWNPLGNSTLLHSFVIFPVSETIFGMSGSFPVPLEAVNVHFQPKWGWKTATSAKKLFLSLVKWQM